MFDEPPTAPLVIRVATPADIASFVSICNRLSISSLSLPIL